MGQDSQGGSMLTRKFPVEVLMPVLLSAICFMFWANWNELKPVVWIGTFPVLIATLLYTGRAIWWLCRRRTPYLYFVGEHSSQFCLLVVGWCMAWCAMVFLKSLDDSWEASMALVGIFPLYLFVMLASMIPLMLVLWAGYQTREKRELLARYLAKNYLPMKINYDLWDDEAINLGFGLLQKYCKSGMSETQALEAMVRDFSSVPLELYEYWREPHVQFHEQSGNVPMEMYHKYFPKFSVLP